MTAGEWRTRSTGDLSLLRKILWRSSPALMAELERQREVRERLASVFGLPAKPARGRPAGP